MTLTCKNTNYETTAFIFMTLTCTFSQRKDKPCTRGYECVNRAEYMSYQAELERSKKFKKGSKAWNNIIQPLTALICNTEDKKVCCKIQIDTRNSDIPDGRVCQRLRMCEQSWMWILPSRVGKEQTIQKRK